MCAWASKYRDFLAPNRRNTRRVLFLTIIGIGTYAISLLAFLAGSSQEGAGVTNPAREDGGFYSMTLKSIDHEAQRINFDLEVNKPEGQGTITKCLHLGTEAWRVGGYSGSLSAVLVNLKEIPRDSLQPDERPGQGLTKYRGSGDFYVETDLHMFPFDKVWWDFSMSEQCWTPAVSIDSTTFYHLSVNNEVPDYSLSLLRQPKNAQENKDASRPHFVLHRSLFLRTLTIIIFAVAFASSIALIIRESEKAKNLSLLTYFAGLWGIRSILLSPIQGLKAFPTLIEITILFLFVFILSGVALASHFWRDGEKATDSGRIDA